MIGKRTWLLAGALVALGMIVGPLGPIAWAVSYTWDANADTEPNPDGGTGAWDTAALNWWDGAANVAWPVTGEENDAVFANTAGTVSIVAGGVTAHNLTFNTTGYVIQDNTLTLNGAAPMITAGSGIGTTISSVIAGSAGLTKSGDGTLILGGASIYTGDTAVNAGTLQIGNGAASGSISGVSPVTVASSAAVQWYRSDAHTIANALSGAG